MHLHGGFRHRQHDEADQRHAGDAIGFEAVGGRANRIAGIVAGAVGDHPWIAGIVFLDLEDDLHQVGADVGDLGEDAAGNAQGGGAQRFADGEADEAFAGQGRWHEQQDRQHDQQFGGDEQHTDGDAGLQRNGVNRIGLAPQRGKGGAAVGQCVDADTEPGHAQRAGDADQREGQDQQHLRHVHLLDPTEVGNDDDRDERLQDQQELALREHVGLAGLVNQLADLGHRAVDRQAANPSLDDRAEHQTANADEQAPSEQGPARDAADKAGQCRVAEIGQRQIGLTDMMGRFGESGRCTHAERE